MNETLRLTTTSTLTIVSESPEALVVETAYTPSTNRPPIHFHPSQDERFDVLAGAVEAVLDGERRSLSEGEVLEVPHGTPHALWAPAVPATLRWTTTPALRTAEFFRAMDAVWLEGDVARLPRVLGEYRDVIAIAG